MSELKAEQWLDYAGEPRPCYPKSETDKVIAGLKEGAKNLILDNYLKDQEIKHHKYKRCLAMALLWLERTENSTDLENELVSRRRCSKWMELAEKFKEAK